MSHTMIQAVRTMYINDQEIGEMGLNAYLAGYYGGKVSISAIEKIIESDGYLLE